MKIHIVVFIFIVGFVIGTYFCSYNVPSWTSYRSVKTVVWLDRPETDITNGLVSITPCPKQHAAYITSRVGNSVICYAGFVLSLKPGRLGNTLISIANMLYLAEKTASEARFPVKQSALDVLLENKNVPTLYDFRQKRNVDECNKVVIVDNFLLSANRSVFLGVSMSQISIAERTRLLRSYFQPHVQIKNKPSLPNSLVVHIRSGDIMRGKGVNPGYVQPPLAFYQKIIIENNFTSVIVVCENRDNPTVNALERWSNLVTVSTGNIHEDVAIILGASHLVLAYGTFSWTLALISDALRHLYVPCMNHCFLASKCDEVPIAATCYMFPDFTPAGSWKNTKAQRALMLSYPMYRITVQKNNNPDYFDV